MSFSVCRIAVVCTALLSTSAALSAQGWIEPEPGLPRPPRSGGIHKTRSEVRVQIEHRVARVTVEEWFRNDGAPLGEAVYHYPLPGEAVFNRFSLWQGDMELTGELMDAAQARAVYQSIVRRRKDPALIELVGHGLLRARVFPIGPGETRKITLRYTQVLDRVGDALRFRYASGRETPPGRFVINVNTTDGLAQAYSPTHRLTTRPEGRQREIQLANPAAGGDVEVLFPLAHNLVGLSLLTHRAVGDDGFFMLLLSPGAAAEATALRRDLVAVLDVSGSMSGEKLHQAQEALAQLVGGLRDGERFRLIAFSNGVRRFASHWTTAGGDSRRLAQDWVRGLRAEGGTNIAGALDEAFAQPPDNESVGVVVFLTDGLPSVGEKDPEQLAERAERGRGRFRVFAFGIGHDVNTYLLDRLADRARGTTQYVAPGGDIERAVGALAAKLASPVLTDLAVAADGVELFDLEPGRLPDLFAGDELVVLGRYRGATGVRSVTVTGRRNGRQERFRTTSTFPLEHGANDYMPPLWAARRAGALAREIRLQGSSPEILDELRRLALRYGILTDYTAYLVQEPNATARRVAEERMRAQASVAPSAQAGAAAVEQSVRERGYSGAVALDEVAEAARKAAPATPSPGAATRRIAGRLFVERSGVWTDTGHDEHQRVVTVAPFSEAYFALLGVLPELRGPAALQPAVIVAGDHVSIKIEERGKTTWSPGELRRLVRAFRG